MCRFGIRLKQWIFHPEQGEGSVHLLLFHHIRIQHALLLKIVRYRILRQKRRLQPGFRPDPLSLIMRHSRRMIAASATAELRTELSALDLVKLLNLAPGLVADRAGNVDLQSHHSHKETLLKKITRQKDDRA